MQLSLISHKVENTLIYQRTIDGYVNATAMCKASGKLYTEYAQLSATREFLQELSSALRIPIAKLVLDVQDGNPELRGYWVHRCSYQFGTMVFTKVCRRSFAMGPRLDDWEYKAQNALSYREVPGESRGRASNSLFNAQ